MKPRVLLQVRSSSNRLPHKCFLLIKNIPSIVYLYNRIKSKRYNTIILTSNDKSDDFLCYILKKYKINFYRGDLQNVKKRFTSFLKKEKSSVIVRLTGDNLFIDSNLISDLINHYQLCKNKYLYLNNESSNLPKGISVEIFDKKILLNIKKDSDHVKEHVTSGFNKLNNEFKLKNNSLKKNYNYRCSLDFIEDYIYLKKKLNNLPINTKWNKLCENLKKYKIKYNRFYFKVLSTNKLSTAYLNQILKLKNSYWKYSLKSQKNFFKNNYKLNDRHILLFNKNILIGYNCLKEINLDNKLLTLLDSFIVRKNHRSRGISHMLISKSMNEIMNMKNQAYLIANKNSLNLYKNFGWTISKYEKIKKMKKNTYLMKFKF